MVYLYNTIRGKNTNTCNSIMQVKSTMLREEGTKTGVLFHLCDRLEKAKLQRQKSDGEKRLITKWYKETFWKNGNYISILLEVCTKLFELNI